MSIEVATPQSDVLLFSSVASLERKQRRGNPVHTAIVKIVSNIDHSLSFLLKPYAEATRRAVFRMLKIVVCRPLSRAIARKFRFVKSYRKKTRSRLRKPKACGFSYAKNLECAASFSLTLRVNIDCRLRQISSRISGYIDCAIGTKIERATRASFNFQFSPFNFKVQVCTLFL